MYHVVIHRQEPRALPSARLVVVPDAGHVVNLQQQAAFNDALTAFVDDLGV